ncbi:MAG: CdaR family protein [Syntrophobacterales bacterium]|nr:CdaR family protein [Syntrophobacterales bacterium]
MKNWFGTFGRNKLLKTLSVLLAIALWFAVSGEERTETTVAMNLELINLHQNLMVTSEVPPSIQVRVMGPRSVINSLSQSRLTETLDLAGYGTGRHTFYFRPNSFSALRGVQVIRIQPNAVTLTLAATMTQTLPVKPVLENNPPEGYEVTGVTIRPDKVKIRGPYNELADLKFIPTLPIDLSHLKEPAVIATDLDFQSLHLAWKESTPIVADIQIASKPLTRNFLKVPIQAGPQPAQVSPAQVTVTVTGPWPQVQALTLENLKARVDTANLTPGRHRLNVSVDLPAGVSVVRTQPGTVTVTVAKSP